MCITNIRQRNLSTNKCYRATFTKAQVGRGPGLKQANMAARRVSSYPQCTDSKECRGSGAPRAASPHGGAPERRSKRSCGFSSQPGGCQSRFSPAGALRLALIRRAGQLPAARSGGRAVSARSPARDPSIWLSSVRPSQSVRVAAVPPPSFRNSRSKRLDFVVCPRGAVRL